MYVCAVRCEQLEKLQLLHLRNSVIVFHLNLLMLQVGETEIMCVVLSAVT